MRRPMMVRLAVVRVLDFARRHSPSARGLIIPAVIVFIGVIAGSYRSELLPFIVAAVVAGASLAALNSPRRERKPEISAAAEPDRFAAPAPPLEASSTTDRYLAELHRFIEVDYVYNILGGAAPPGDMAPMAEHDWQALQSRGDSLGVTAFAPCLQTLHLLGFGAVIDLHEAAIRACGQR